VQLQQISAKLRPHCTQHNKSVQNYVYIVHNTTNQCKITSTLYTTQQISAKLRLHCIQLQQITVNLLILLQQCKQNIQHKTFCCIVL